MSRGIACLLAVFAIRVWWTALLVAGSMACGYRGPVVVVSGTPAGLERLVGQWQGEYVGDLPTGGRGSIFFTLVAGDRDAHGDVVMIPDRAVPYGVSGGEPRWTEDRESTHVLTIRFVRADVGGVFGTLDPYWDPERQTRAAATFAGEFRGDRIEGRFSTAYANGQPLSRGRWFVTRKHAR